MGATGLSGTALRYPRRMLGALRRRLGLAIRSPLSAHLPGDAIGTLGKEIFALDYGLGLFRLVHLLDALVRAGRVRTILSVGSGGGVHESFLAHAFPRARVIGVDRRMAYHGAWLPNLSFREGELTDPAFLENLPQSDFVYSLECLEHVQDDGAVFEAMARAVAPGGHLLVEVPFANEGEQADPRLREQEHRLHGHVRPGYDARQLTAMSERAGLHTVLVSNVFWFPVQPLVWLAFKSLDYERLVASWRPFVSVAEQDLRIGLAASREEAAGIKILARRPRRLQFARLGRL